MREKRGKEGKTLKLSQDVVSIRFIVSSFCCDAFFMAGLRPSSLTQKVSQAIHSMQSYRVSRSWSEGYKERNQVTRLVTVRHERFHQKLSKVATSACNHDSLLLHFKANRSSTLCTGIDQLIYCTIPSPGSVQASSFAFDIATDAFTCIPYDSLTVTLSQNPRMQNDHSSFRSELPAMASPLTHPECSQRDTLLNLFDHPCLRISACRPDLLVPSATCSYDRICSTRSEHINKSELPKTPCTHISVVFP